MCGFVTKSVVINWWNSVYHHMLPVLLLIIIIFLFTITGFRTMGHVPKTPNELFTTDSMRSDIPAVSEELLRKDRLCSSINQNSNGCALHAFRQRSEFYNDLEVNGDIYVCDDEDCTQEEVYNKIAPPDAQPLDQQFGTLSGIIHHSQGRGIHQRVANYILKGNVKEYANTLRVRHSVLQEQQATLGKIITDANKKYELYQNKLRQLGERTWYNYCEGTPYQADYGLYNEPKNLDSRKKLCYDAYWLW
jgi:hypothetical protein